MDLRYRALLPIPSSIRLSPCIGFRTSVGLLLLDTFTLPLAS